MVLAKDHLNIPRVITPEDFANEALDELSAMTYLSYFVRHESPGYYHTLNWVCKQLRTTNITNLTVSVICEPRHAKAWFKYQQKHRTTGTLALFAVTNFIRKS